jgi:hypothetical protein
MYLYTRRTTSRCPTYAIWPGKRRWTPCFPCLTHLRKSECVRCAPVVRPCCDTYESANVSAHVGNGQHYYSHRWEEHDQCILRPPVAFAHSSRQPAQRQPRVRLAGGGSSPTLATLRVPNDIGAMVPVLSRVWRLFSEFSVDLKRV